MNTSCRRRSSLPLAWGLRPRSIGTCGDMRCQGLRGKGWRRPSGTSFPLPRLAGSRRTLPTLLGFSRRSSRPEAHVRDREGLRRGAGVAYVRSAAGEALAEPRRKYGWVYGRCEPEPGGKAWSCRPLQSGGRAQADAEHSGSVSRASRDPGVVSVDVCQGHALRPVAGGECGLVARGSMGTLGVVGHLARV